MKTDRFTVDSDGHTLVGDCTSSPVSMRLLCLHGAGTSDRKRFDPLRNILIDKSLNSYAFDFTGHGETGGDLFSSSLKNRVDQALAVIDAQQIIEPLSIIASSMGGYIGIKLTNMRAVKNLILIAPAVYDVQAYTAIFGPQFTEAIRRSYSWRDTDAWEILANYTGNLVIFAAEKDQVIPNEIIQKIYTSAQKARTRDIITIPDATHSLLSWLNERPDFLHSVAKEICKTVLS